MAISVQEAWSMDMSELKRAMETESKIPDSPAELTQLQNNFEEFCAQNAQFHRSAENVSAMLDYCAWKTIPSPQDFAQMAALAAYDGRLSVSGDKPEGMTLGQLRDAAFGATQRDPAWEMDMSELSKRAGIP